MRRASYIHRRLPLGDFSKSGAPVIVTMQAVKCAARYFCTANNQGKNEEREVPASGGKGIAMRRTFQIHCSNVAILQVAM